MTLVQSTRPGAPLDAVIEASHESLRMRDRWHALHQELDVARLAEGGAFVGHYQGRLTLEAYQGTRAAMAVLEDREAEAFDAYLDSVGAIEDAWAILDGHGGGRRDGFAHILPVVTGTQTPTTGTWERDTARDEHRVDLDRQARAEGR